MAGPAMVKSKRFALQIIGLYKELRNEKKEFVMSAQILRSGTSIGANLAEAECAVSRKDLLSKLSIALKECSETRYWLELLYKTGYISEDTFKTVTNSCGAIRRMLISSINTVKNNNSIK